MRSGLRCLKMALIVLFIVFYSIGYQIPAFAFIPEIAFDDMVQLADIVFVGKAEQLSPKIAKNRKMVETDVIFTQIQVIHQKDTVTENIGSQITLTYEGGRFNDAYTLVSDMPSIETGQRYLVFAYYDGQSHANPFVGGMQGLMKIAADEITGKQYPLKHGDSGISEIREGRLRLSPGIKKIRRGVLEKAESRMNVKRAADPKTLALWPGKPHSQRDRMPQTIMDLDELTGHIEKSLNKRPSKQVLEKRSKRAASVLQRRSDPAAAVEENGWEFSDGGKIIVLNPDKVHCPPVESKIEGEAAVYDQKTAVTSPSGGTSWDDIWIYGWHDLPVIMDLVPTDYWTYVYDTQAMGQYNLYIDELFRVRPWDGSFANFNTYSEFCGFLTDAQKRDVYGSGWGDAIAVCRIIGAACESCQIFEADVMFAAEENWTGDYQCQLSRTVADSPCYQTYLYLPVAVHELGHTLGLLSGGMSESYDYDIPTVMNGGLENAVEDGRGLHVGDAYLLRYWYADQRSSTSMNYDDIGIESWVAQGGTVNAVTDKRAYAIGEQIWIENVTVENIGRHDAPNVRIRAFLSKQGELKSLISERNELDLGLIPADRMLIGPPPSNEYYEWSNLSSNTFWAGELAFVIPDHIPMGDYYINLVVTANNDQSVIGAEPGDTSYHEITIQNNHTFVKLPIEVTCPEPSAPANFSIQETDVDGVVLTWDAVADARYYKVMRVPVDDPENTTILTSTLTANSYKDTSGVPGTYYYYGVSAQSSCRAWSDWAFSSWAASRLLTPPCIKSATDGTSADEIQVIAQRVDQGDYYCFYYSTVNDPATAVQVPGECWTSDTSALHMNATPGQTYYYWAKAATSDTGNRASGLGGACPDHSGWRKLSPPAEVTASQSDTEGIRISWSAVSGAAAYQVYRHTENNPAAATAITDWWADLLTFFDSPLDEGRQYYYWVRSSVGANGDRPSDFSASAVGWKSYEPARKVDMTGLGASKGSSGDKIVISWWPASNDSYYYRVYRTTDFSPEGDPAASLATPVSGWQQSISVFEDTTGIPGVDYGYFVSRAYDANGNRESDWQRCSACFDSGWRALSSPTGIGASPGTFADRIRVTWAAAEGATHYRVYRGTSEAYSLKNPPVPISGFITGTQFDDMDPALESKTTYYYWVTGAINAAGDRESGSIGTLGKRGYKASSPPDGVSATDGAHTNKIVIVWNPVPGLDEYRVYRNTVNDPDTAARLSGWQTSLTFDDETADTGQVYYYWVKARLNARDTEPSPSSQVDTGYRGFVPPAGVAASDGTHTDKVAVSWQASPGAEYYRVYRSTSNNPTEAVAASTWQTALSYEDTGANVGIEYHYFVAAAVNSRGGLASELGTGDAGHRVLAPPKSLLVSQGTYKSLIGISWDKGNDESIRYRVFRSMVNDPATAQAASGWQSALTFEDTAVDPGQTYYYWVKGSADVDGAIESAWSNNGIGQSGYACATPDPPVNFREQGTDAEGIGLSWDPTPGARRYQLLRHTTNDVANAQILAGGLGGTDVSSAPAEGLSGADAGDPTPVLPGDLTVAFYKDSSAVPGMAYYYWVSVQNECMVWSDPAPLAGPAIRPLGSACIESVTDGTSTQEIRITAQGVDSATHYCFYYDTEDSPDNAVPLPGACWVPDTTVSHTGTEPGRTHYYWVRAATGPAGENAGDLGGGCPDNSGWRALEPPEEILASDGLHADKVIVSWQPVLGATHYRVYRSIENNPAIAQPVSGWQSAMIFEDEAVTAGQTYHYWVAGAVDAEGEKESAWSASESGYTSLIPGDIDGNGTVNLTDAIVTLQLLSGMTTSLPVHASGDVNGNKKIGIEEVSYILKVTANVVPLGELLSPR